MKVHDDFLNPLCTRNTLDIYCIRRSLVEAVRSHLSVLEGLVLDIGSGDVPYKPLIMGSSSRIRTYVAMDIQNTNYGEPDLLWDGKVIPIADNSLDCALAIEVLEHCPQPEQVLAEACRVLKPGGLLFFTVPFLWPLHCVPQDEYRYTPFALQRLLKVAGFRDVKLEAHGGWDLSLAQMIGLWSRRRPMSAWKRAVCCLLAVPLVRFLASRERPSSSFDESLMITGISGTARKSALPCLEES